MSGVHNGTLYKLLGRIVTDGCNSYVVHEEGNKEVKTPIVCGGNTMLWN